MRTRNVQAEGTEAVILHAVGSTHFPPESGMELDILKPDVGLNCETVKMCHFPLVSLYPL